MSKLYKFIFDSLSKNMSKSKLTKNQLLVKINQLTTSLEEQKRENNVMKESYATNIDLYKALISSKIDEISSKQNEITHLMSMKYEYNERLKEKDKIHKLEKEERKKTYKHEIELIQQTINHLELTIN